MASSVEGPEEVPSNEKEQEKKPGEVIPEKGEQISDTTTPTSQSREKTMSIVVHEQNPREADNGATVPSLDHGKVSHATPQPLQPIMDGRSPAIREKVLEDGYNWRKYGQKLVKGNEFVRSYYKCTHPSCQVKKQLERSHEGRLADIVYFGQHDHPKHQANLPLPVGFVSSVEERSDGPLSPAVKVGKRSPPIDSMNASYMLTSSEDVKAVPTESTRKRDELDHHDDPQSKRQKKGNRGIVDPPPAVDKPTSEPRVVVQTSSDEDIVTDGYRWRKYGQKMVKGNPNPRSYYRCSSPGCPVKKHVERASHDPKVVITSYEGEHDHDMPPSRNVTRNVPCLDICTPIVPPTGQLDSSKTACCKTPDANAKPKEQHNGESRTKTTKGASSKGSVVDTGTDKVSPSPIPLDKSDSKDHQQQQHDKSCALEESDAATGDHDSDATTSSVLEGRTNDQHTGESKDASEEKNSCGWLLF